jgi:hypothetical protein
MVKLFPSKGIVMIKTTKNKRTSGEITEGTQKPEEQPHWGKADKGGGKGYGKGGWWAGHHEEKQKTRYDAQGRTQPQYS